MSAERLSVFPAFHKVDGRPVLVVGEGAEAAAKLRLLCETTAIIRLVAEHPDPDLAELAGQPGIEHRAKPFSPDDLEGAVLVFAASGERARDAAVVAAARARNIPANAVDVPDLCDFYTPAIVNRAPVAIAITSTGAGPVLAQKLRARIEAMVPGPAGCSGEPCGVFPLHGRPRAAQGPAAAALLVGFLRGRCGGRSACRAIRRCPAARHPLLTEAETAKQGFVWLVGAGPGAADLLTLRAQRILQEADVIVHDALFPRRWSPWGRRDATRIHVGKRKGRHLASQDEINAILVREARAGRRVVRLKCGDPLVFGRAGEEMAALRAAALSFEVVPGVTSALAAAAEAEIPLTLRGTASTLVFATGQDAAGDVLPDWAGLAFSGATVVVYMGRSVASRVAARLAEAGLNPATPVAIIESATLPGRRVISGSLTDLAAYGSGPDSGGPALILIGDAVAQGALGAAEPLVPARELAA
jgi:uroporphyrin-III C-methyltransferase/precorrin-2 dehydrogenase/sirohydrochlorin ferrochelatase